MLSTLIKLLGSPYAIPFAFIALAGWGIKHLLELASFRRQHRRDFLDLWDQTRCGDNLRLEVLTRHLVGEYLPAGVVRAALKEAFPSRMLLDIAGSWSDLRFDHVTGMVALSNDRYQSRGFRAFMSAVWLGAYVACALGTWRFATWAWSLGPAHLVGWLYGFTAAVLAVCAVACVGKEQNVRQLGRVSSSLLTRLNAHLRQAASLLPNESGVASGASGPLDVLAAPGAEHAVPAALAHSSSEMEEARARPLLAPDCSVGLAMASRGTT